jgi:hypothetical protein
LGDRLSAETGQGFAPQPRPIAAVILAAQHFDASRRHRIGITVGNLPPEATILQRIGRPIAIAR